METFLILVHVCDSGNNGGCDQICNKDGDQAACTCRKGFKLSSDKVSCIKGNALCLFFKGGIL